MTVLGADRVVTAGGVLDDGWIEVRDSVVTAVGDTPRAVDARHHLLLPGFVDLHVHGGGGHDVTASREDAERAVAFHRRHGTTATLLSLVTAPVAALCEQLDRLADLVETPGSGVVGLHLEGPFLAASRRGAQHPDHLRSPDVGVTRELLAAGRGHVRCMTLAPELPGAFDVIDVLCNEGVIAAVGHTDATYATSRAAFDRGARLATHLYNGMRPVHHREPGPVLAALDAGVVCEVVDDGRHVHPAVLREVEARGPGRLALVTDAIAAAGAPDGRYELGGQEVEVVDGTARLVAGGTLAGSTLTLDAAVRRALTDGLALDRVAAAAATTPALVLGLADRHGALAAGRSADVVGLDDQLRVERVLVAGVDVELGGVGEPS